MAVADCVAPIAATASSVTSAQFDSWLRPLLTATQENTLACAVSGGGDSMALVVLAHQWTQIHGGKCIALLVDHGLRPESADEANITQQRLNSLGITSEILRWNHDDMPRANLQEKARDARYRLLLDACKQQGINTLLTAHHANDQAETLLLRLKRGSHISGLAAIPAMQKREGIRILRPLLACHKNALLALLNEHKIGWIEDPSNHDLRFDRSHARQFLQQLPQAEGYITALVKATSHFAVLRRQKEEKIAVLIKQYVTIHPAGYAQMRAEAWNQLEKDYACLLLQRLILAINGQEKPLRFQQLENLSRNIYAAQSSTRFTLAGCVIQRKQERGEPILLFLREPKRLPPPYILQSGESMLFDNRYWVELADLEMLPASLHVAALNEHGAKQLRHAKFSDIPRLPREAFLSLPALWHLEELLCVPHINYTKAKIPENAFSAVFQPPKPLDATSLYSL